LLFVWLSLVRVAQVLPWQKQSDKTSQSKTLMRHPCAVGIIIKMRIILLGAPGSGKGTQAALLRDRMNLVHISTGDLLRAARAAGTPLGLKAKAVMDRGELVSDDIVLGMLEERLMQPDTAPGVIFDGYPRNVAQANALTTLLSKLKMPLDRAILLDVSKPVLLGRLAERAKKEGRADDTPETIAHRLNVYHEQTEPVVGYYQALGMVSKVVGEGTMEEIYTRIAAALKA
jgi:adenylate kinase